MDLTEIERASLRQAIRAAVADGHCHDEWVYVGGERESCRRRPAAICSARNERDERHFLPVCAFHMSARHCVPFDAALAEALAMPSENA